MIKSSKFPIALLIACASAAGAAHASASQVEGQEVVVEARRAALSEWYEAETPHAVIVSDGSERDVIRIARNVERLHFLLAGLMGLAGKPSEVVKLRVTLIGDTAEFQGMGLRNLRWQQGPYTSDFQPLRYYDPREDGSVLAASRIDQKVVLEQGTSLQSLSTVIESVNRSSGGSSSVDAATTGIGSSALAGLSGSSDLVGAVNEKGFPLPAENVIYAGYAQHFLTTYFPAAYPRWYLDGFGQVFASLETRGDGELEFGRAPVGTTATLRKYGDYSIERVLNGTYLQEKQSNTRWTPAHAWLLTHFLFFSDSRRPQLKQYLLAYGNGTSSAEAARAFGDLREMAQELRRYHHSKKPFERISYPAAEADEPIVRRLKKSEAAFVKGRLELGSRIEIPAPPPAGAPTETVRGIEKARAFAIAARSRWLDGLRRDAQRYPLEPEAQLLLAEAECRIGNIAPCAAAADRALALAPNDGRALAWKGIALVNEAEAAAGEQRGSKLKEARAVIARANRADTDAVMPLLAYYRSFAAGDGLVPNLAVDALAAVVARVPNAPAPRVTLSSQYLAHDVPEQARITVRPVALGGWDTPEQAQAREILKEAH